MKRKTTKFGGEEAAICFHASLLPCFHESLSKLSCYLYCHRVLCNDHFGSAVVREDGGGRGRIGILGKLILSFVSDLMRRSKLTGIGCVRNLVFLSWLKCKLNLCCGEIFWW